MCWVDFLLVSYLGNLGVELWITKVIYCNGKLLQKKMSLEKEKKWSDLNEEQLH